MFIADNLAAHAFGWFIYNFSAVQSFCRPCNTRGDQLNKVKLVLNFTLRTKNACNNNITAIEEDPDSSALYGLKERSFLNELYYYHVGNGFPPDLAHDLLEGFAVVVVSNVIIFFIREGLFKLDELNNIILNFD